MTVENCMQCGISLPNCKPMQKYCPDCSNARQAERHRVWARQHPNPNWHERRTVEILDQQKRGAINSSAPAAIWELPEPIDSADLNHIVRVAIPFSYGYSKNAIYAMTGKGHIYLRERTRELRNILTTEIIAAMSDSRFFVNRIYLDIFVEKPDHKGDAVNVIDTVCDAVKDAICIDDRWFSIRSLDWNIVKNGGRLIVGISQAATEDARVCHRCGQIYPLSDYSSNKNDKLGKSRVCSKCRKK